jgi:Rrf2 family protein
LQLNITTDYGVRVVIYLAQENKIVSSKKICTQTGIPCGYMHKIAIPLKNAGIIQEVRGSRGGFLLKTSPDNISVLTVVNAFESTMFINRCLEKDKYCSINATADCKVHKLYCNTQTELNNMLNVKISTLI